MAAAPDHRQPRAGRTAQGRLGLRPADRARRARRVAADPARAAALGTRRSASSPSTAACGRSAVRSPRPRGRGARARRGSCARPSRRAEAALAGIEPVPLRHLAEAAAYLRGEGEPRPVEPASGICAAAVTRTSPTCAARSERGGRSRSPPRGGTTFSSRGRPGPGKTMLARRLPGVLPPLTPDEALEVTRIHSVAGVLPPGQPLVDVAAVPRAAPQCVGRRRSSEAGPARAPARRASRTAAFCCSTSCPSSSGPPSRRCASHSRTGRQHRPRRQGMALFPARFQLVAHDESLSLRCPRRPLSSNARAQHSGWRRFETSSRGLCSTASTSS